MHPPIQLPPSAKGRIRILFTFVVSFLYAAGCGHPAPDAPPQAAWLESDAWYGAYIGGQRAGYLREVTSKTKDGGFRLYAENVLAVKSLDHPVSLKMIETLETTPDFKPKTYFQTVDGGVGHPYHVRGKTSGNEFRLEIESNGRVLKTKKFDLSGDLTFPQLADQLIRSQDMEVGKRWEFNVVNPADLLPIRIQIHVDRFTTVRVGETDKPVFQVTAKMGVFEIVSYVDTSQPNPYRIEVPSLGVEYLLEDRQSATRSVPESARIDVAYFSAVIPVSGAALPDRPDRVRLKLTGVDLAGLDLAGSYQIVVNRTPSETLLDIRTPDLSSVKNVPPVRPARGVPDTSAPAPLADLVRSLYRPLPLDFARSAVDWMQSNIRQVPTSIVPTASEVLDLGQGDCNEFSALFSALAQEAGFPCKIISGVVYMDGRYFYHSWNEIESGGRWIPVDPILNEIPASAKHIKLLEGDFSTAWRLAGVIGRLQIEILPN